MKKINSAFILPIFLAVMAYQEANAACIPHHVAESAVEERTYVQMNSPNSQYPNYLLFGTARDLKAGYGSALDGNPMGQFHFHGNCHGDVIITFTSSLGLNSTPTEIFRLRPMDSKYFQLRSMDGIIFNIVSGN